VTDTPPRYYTAEEVAARLRLSRMTIYRMSRRHELPGAVWTGNTLRIHVETFEAWEQARIDATLAAS
jgi:excisionase family DNA binding protein